VYSEEMIFDIEKISDKILEHIEELMIEKISVANDYSIVKEQFGKVKDVQRKLKLDSLDFVFVYENKKSYVTFDSETYKLEIGEIYNRINHKMCLSKKIPTFFRSTDGNVPAFHLPGNFNIWFLESKNFTSSNIKPYVVVDLEAGVFTYLKNSFDKKETKDLYNEMKYTFVNCNDYFSYDKHVNNTYGNK
jgi:hypothetical protein